jgi:hypothetical protein
VVRHRLVTLMMVGAVFAHSGRPAAADDVSRTAAAGEVPAAAGFTLSKGRFERTGERAGRYTLRARLAPVESAGELRESGSFALIGRFAKAGASCDGDRIFSDGFED